MVGKAAESEVPEFALQKILGADMTDRDVVGSDLGHVWHGRCVIEVDQRQAQLCAGLNESRRRIVTDDTVPFPASHPAWINFRLCLVVQGHRPRAMRPLKMHDALEHLRRFMPTGREYEQDLGVHGALFDSRLTFMNFKPTRLLVQLNPSKQFQKFLRPLVVKLLKRMRF